MEDIESKMSVNENCSPYVWLEVDTNILKNNYKLFKELVHPSVCAAVLKADAYGLGANNVGKFLFEAGCRDFFVAYFDEAHKLKNFLKQELNVSSSYEKGEGQYDLFVLDGPFIADWCEVAHKRRFIPVLNSLQNIKEWNEYGESLGEVLPAVLHIDTGMNRLGMPMYEYAEFKNNYKAKVYKNIDWRFFMSHPVASGDTCHRANEIQEKAMNEIVNEFPDIKFSYADTGAVVRDKKLHLDLVRIGFGFYGINTGVPGVKICLKAYGIIIQVRNIEKNDGIGYSWDFVSEKPRKIATVSCGYADGISYNSSVRVTNFVINGKKAKILGKISMDLTIVDVTDIEDVKIGDKVTIFGDEANVDDLIFTGGFSVYKILSGFSNRMKHFFS